MFEDHPDLNDKLRMRGRWDHIVRERFIVRHKSNAKWGRLDEALAPVETQVPKAAVKLVWGRDICSIAIDGI